MTDRRSTLIPSGTPSAGTTSPTGALEPSAAPPSTEPGPQARADHPGAAPAPAAPPTAMATLAKRPWVAALVLLPVAAIVTAVLIMGGGSSKAPAPAASSTTAKATTSTAVATTTTTAPAGINPEVPRIPGGRPLSGVPGGAVKFGTTWVAPPKTLLTAPATAWGDRAKVTAYQWERCDPGPRDCEAMKGQTGSKYRVPDLPARTVLRVVMELDQPALVLVSAPVQVP